MIQLGVEEIIIDGSSGEGGGQILRTALSLSIIAGRPVRFRNIRAGRKKPGLMRQHLAAVNAAAKICHGQLDGATLGSKSLTFVPGAIRSGEYQFAVGSAGSACLVLQTVLPPLLTADGVSQLSIQGGTHNPKAPPFDFLARCFLPQLTSMGANVSLTLECAGFYPAGGGRLTAVIQPCDTLQPLELMARGARGARRARALIANLPDHIAKRELGVVRDELSWSDAETQVESLRAARGPCNALVLEVCYEHVSEIVTGFGEKGVRAERVARDAVAELRRYLSSTAPVGKHLADQLMVPLALAGEGCFRTAMLSQHARTNIETIQRFIDVSIRVEPQADGVVIAVG